MSLIPIRTIAPASVPVTTAEAKVHLNVDFSDDDALIDALVLAATEALDGYVGTLHRALLTQTWVQSFGCFRDELLLPLAPVSAISSVTYFDGSNAQQTLATSVYRLLSKPIGPVVVRQPDQTWPSSYTREDAVSVEFVCGYGAATDIPKPIKQAILLMVGHLYENREAVNVGNIVTELPFAAKHLVAPYRRNII